MMIFLTRPKYYIPVKGEYRMLCANAMIAEEMGIPPEHILLLDNGQVAQFEDGELVSTKMELQLHDTMIDGKENWDDGRRRSQGPRDPVDGWGHDPGHRRRRENEKDRQRTGYPVAGADLPQGFGIHHERCAKIMEETIEENVKNKTYDNLETRQDIRDKVAKYLFKQTAKRPMVLPVILEINQ